MLFFLLKLGEILSALVYVYDLTIDCIIELTQNHVTLKSF